MNKYDMKLVEDYKSWIEEVLRMSPINEGVKEGLKDALEWLESLEKQKTLFDF
ncbi:MAG: hypothetical protein ACTSVA_06510 [Candidatus Njordarchaeales archaeon]